jgi:hypothetical protein
MTEAEGENENGRAMPSAPEIHHGVAQHRERTNSTMQEKSSSSRVPQTPALDVEAAEAYLAAGYELIPLHSHDSHRNGKPLGKTPKSRGWRTASPMSLSELREHIATGGNVGVRLRAEDLVIDVDPRNGGNESFKKLVARFPLPDDVPTVVTGTNGTHFYLHKPAELEVVGGLAEYPGIDFKKFGGYVVAAGSIHPDTKGPYYWDQLADSNDLTLTPMAPEALLAALTKRPKAPSQEAVECKPEQLEEFLEALDPSDYSDYLTWLRIGMAAHHATGGSDEGMEVFVAWSERDPIYAGRGDETRAKWPTFSVREGEQVTIGTILYHLNQVGRGDLVDKFWRSPAEEDFADDPDISHLGTAPIPVRFMENRGRIEPNYRNTQRAVEFGRFEPGFDVLAQMPVLRAKHLPWKVDVGREINDDLLRIVREWIMEQFGFEPSRENVSEVLRAQATKNPFNPVVEYLDGLVWDGVHRIDGLFSAYFGAADGPYERAVGRKFMLAAVRRARVPGTKFDTVPIIEGKQGAGKTSALRILGGAWHSDAELGRVDGKDAAGVLHGVWIMELGELTAMNKAEVDSLKAFVSRCEDRYRPAYGSAVKTFARRCVFVGTTNSSQYLRDLTGNRRYLPVEAGQIDQEALRRDRDQLWAEASAVEAAGESLVIPQELWSVAGERQDDRLVTDPWLDPLRAFVANKSRVSSRAIFEEALLLPLGRSSQAEAKRAAGLMASLGFSHKKSLRIDGQVTSGYERD